MQPLKRMRLKITGIDINNAGIYFMRAFIVIGTLLTLSAILLTLAGCATKSGKHSMFQPATRDGIGYKEFFVSDTHYRIQFKARGNQRTAARDYALMRAAELSVQQGYDWFVVSKQTVRILDETEGSFDNPEFIENHRCGLLGCRNQTRQLSAQAPGLPETYTLVLLDIHMGKGIRPEKNSYGAQETWDRLTVKK